jgi:hypothetical protein
VPPCGIIGGGGDEMEKKPFDKIAYNNSFIASAYDRVNLTLPKGDKYIIKAHAEARGEKVNTFIQRAIKETIERDNEKNK